MLIDKQDRGIVGKYCMLLMVLLLPFSTIHAIDLRRDYASLVNQFNQGQIDAVTDQLLRLQPNTDEERAFILYYSGLLKAILDEAKQVHQQNINRYPNTYHGQKSMLEVAKSQILEHDLTNAKALLRRITHVEIPERLYWQAVCTFHLDEYAEASGFADNYIRQGAAGEYFEQAYYLLAESQTQQNRHQNAVATLARLKAVSGYPTDEQYFYYKLGYAQERSSNNRDALQSYQRGYEINKYNQIAYLIEDRLFAMRSRLGAGIDISFLYPYTELTDCTAIVTTTPVPNQEMQNSSNSTSLQDAQAYIPLRVTGRPNRGIFLQAGRFSIEANAISRANEIRSQNLPSFYFEEQQGGRATWVVMSGPYDGNTLSEQARQNLIANNIDCFIVRY